MREHPWKIGVVSLPPLLSPFSEKQLSANYWTLVKTEHLSHPTWYFGCGIGQKDSWLPRWEGPCKPLLSHGPGVFKNLAVLARGILDLHEKMAAIREKLYSPIPLPESKALAQWCLWFIKVTLRRFISTFKLHLRDSSKCLLPLSLLCWLNWNPVVVSGLLCLAPGIQNGKWMWLACSVGRTQSHSQLQLLRSSLSLVIFLLTLRLLLMTYGFVYHLEKRKIGRLKTPS